MKGNLFPEKTSLPSPQSMKDFILKWLKEENPEKLETLFQKADRIREEYVGDEVYLRGLVEISNFCRSNCLYCGLRSSNSMLERYRMNREEILECAGRIERCGIGTVVLQSGEDPGLDCDFVSDIIREIKSRTSLAVTLSLGERSREELEAWKKAGADRYFLRFESSDAELLRKIRPSFHSAEERHRSRLEILEELRKVGYETGSGVMIGFPGQTLEILAEDLLLMVALDLDMVGCGPYIPHPQTPLGKLALEGSERIANSSVPCVDGVPSTLLMTKKVIALARILMPESNIPATTSVSALSGEKAREEMLGCGANVVMPDFTPEKYRVLYQIYPNKSCQKKEAELFIRELEERLSLSGRCIGKGNGKRRRRKIQES